MDGLFGKIRYVTTNFEIYAVRRLILESVVFSIHSWLAQTSNVRGPGFTSVSLKAVSVSTKFRDIT